MIIGIHTSAAVGDASAGDGSASAHVIRFATPKPSMLTVVETAGCAAPRWARRDQVGAVLAGELYQPDSRRLAEELGRDPNAPEVELLLDGYLQQGEALLDRLRGIFILVLWHAGRRRLVAIRDPAGHVPLFYHVAGGELLLATSATLLVDRPEVSRAVNRHVLAEHLRSLWSDPEETFYRDIRRVPPGHRLEGPINDLRARRYWDPAPPNQPVDWVDSREVEPEAFTNRLAEAVERCSQRSHDAGIFLSGGLDSISVATALADGHREQQRQLPLALSLVFPHPGLDERTTQQGVARALGLDQVLIDLHEALPERGVLRSSLALSRSWPTPAINPWLPAFVQLAKEARARGVRRIFTGGGGDEWLSTSPFLAADLLLRGDLRGLVQLLWHLNASYSTPAYRLAGFLSWRFTLRPLIAAAIGTGLQQVPPALCRQIWRRRIAALTPAWLCPDRALRHELLERGHRQLPVWPDQGFYLREVRRALDHPLVCMELEGLYEMGRRVGVTVRQPYWDADLIDLLYRIPPQWLIEDRGKRQVRERLARRFSSLDLANQRKNPGVAYYQGLMLDEIPQTLRELGGFKALADLGVVDGVKAASNLVSIVDERRVRSLGQCYALLATETWARAQA